MNNLKKTILEQYSKDKKKIQARLNEFRTLPENLYIKEFMFCILTPQSNAQRCWEAVAQIQLLKDKNKTNVAQILKTKTRFHNNKTLYLLEGLSKWDEIKQLIKSQNIKELRNVLAENVKGYGLKESSHFLRNIGKSSNKIAILDRHILKNLKEFNIISDNKIKSKNNYLETEEKFLKFSKQIGIPPDELDLLFWSMENGEIFK
ncbi:MAG: DNA lyase [Nanoarchaeota archaeon]